MVDDTANNLVHPTLLLLSLGREKAVTLRDLGGAHETGNKLRAIMHLLPSLKCSLGADPSMSASVLVRIIGTLNMRFNDAPA